MAVKCKGCGHRIEGRNLPQLCPKCGKVMVPYTVKTEGKEKKERFLEPLED
ncbi:MAG: hypothetical protein VB088_02150 [Sphaerochaeta sp.]|nr:hypothetical protein [Sphaerochaeta sp.]